MISDFLIDIEQGLQRVRCLGDRATDHQIAGTGLHGSFRTHHPRLVVEAGMCRPDARRHQTKFIAAMFAQQRGFLR